MAEFRRDWEIKGRLESFGHLHRVWQSFGETFSNLEIWERFEEFRISLKCLGRFLSFLEFNSFWRVSVSFNELRKVLESFREFWNILERLGEF